jgi:two-component system response regulator CpxR
MRPKKVILCVDGDEKALSLRTFLLNTRANHCVMNAHNFGQALEILERTIPGTMDLLIVDLLLPGMDGNELVRRAKAMHPALPCLITSGTVATWERALYADAFLPKCSAEDLLERIRLMVERKRGPKRRLPLTAPQQAAVDHALKKPAQSVGVAEERRRTA